MKLLTWANKDWSLPRLFNRKYITFYIWKKGQRVRFQVNSEREKREVKSMLNESGHIYTIAEE